MKFINWLTFPIKYSFSKLKRKFGKLDLVRMEVLLAFGNEHEIFIKGRLVEAYKQSNPSPKKSALQNFIATLRRYAGNSVSDVQVKLQFQDAEKLLVSNEEGLFEVKLPLNVTENKSVECAQLTLIEDEGIVAEIKTVRFIISRYSTNTPLGIISDIDDTIIISHATSLGKKLWLSISKNAYTRRPFPGVSTFYNYLSNDGQNPVFYVSSSDWNLFHLIQDFLEYRRIPKGPLLLKDPHVTLRNIWKSGGGSHEHKLEKISQLMTLFPKTKFILIGDSGQHDPELYTRIIETFPNQVKAVYIRRIKKVDKEREDRLNSYNHTIPIAWVKNSEEALTHAKSFL
ncbi:phosphatase domain-containing protein [Belliella kenyensis]|uniref:Phosphatase domain-containing protein n=1 Tax=Belliella kenyensis TaxID=1472724 RepID=A0ABV8ENP5_9BACT|nr:phosphatase domain-containing protein [Belliella kenyensis]MCH7402008.1 DUF2183 domain-containing protein [Belliella kenyensis]MDN3605172.1 DUF2183 domain-containing protein [Belliella kenyensis]